MTGKALWRKARSPFEYFPVRVAAGLTAFLPYRALGFWAARLGRLADMVPSRRRLVRANLRVAFPDWSPQQVEEIAVRAWRNIMLTALEVFWFVRHGEELSRFVRFDTSVGEAILAKGARGPTILLTPHLGNWELIAQGFAAAGGRLCAVARPVRNRWLAALVERARRQHGMEIIPSRGASRRALRALRDGNALGMLIDQNTRPRRGGVFVDFFGLPVPTTRAPAALARRLKTDVLCAALVRSENGFQLDLAELERPPADYRDDIELTAALLRLNEELIRRHPDQYVWNYERWRYVPDDAPPELRRRYPFYAKL
ncbi:MAG: hypothetical protein GXP31_12065 [Kiritimatiellaeota bacterium]|nr:hypothetical protein [Kiritimatiellota bacterium]